MTKSIKDFDKAIKSVFESSFVEMENNIYIGEDRAPIFVAACVIFKTIYDELKLASLTASLKGAMEAIIEDLIIKWQHN